MSQLIEYRPGFWLVETELAGYDMDVRSVVFCGEQRALVWDTMPRPSDLAGVNAVIAGKSTVVVYSHADWDHIWGTAAIMEPLLVTGHKICQERFKQDVPDTLAQMRKEKPGMWSDVRLIPPSVVFSSRMEIDLGGVTVMLEHLPGHTSDSIIGYIPEWGVFLGGDSIETPIPISNEQNPILPWAEALEKWAAVPGLTTVIPAHGAIGGREILQGNAAYLRGILEGKTTGLLGELAGFYVESHQSNLEKHQGKI